MTRRITILAAVALVLAVALVFSVRQRRATPAAEPAFAFDTTTIALPDDTAELPAGRHVEVVTTNCTACHSASMITQQPALTRDQWTATVTKMRDVYKAPVADADVAPIVSYLEELSAKKTMK